MMKFAQFTEAQKLWRGTKADEGKGQETMLELKAKADKLQSKNRNAWVMFANVPKKIRKTSHTPSVFAADSPPKSTSTA